MQFHKVIPKLINSLDLKLNNKSNKRIRFQTSVFRSDLFNCSNTYIVVKGTVTGNGNGNSAGFNRKVRLKICAPFTSHITKINNTLIDYADNLDILMPMYNLFEYSKSYSKASESFLKI